VRQTSNNYSLSRSIWVKEVFFSNIWAISVAPLSPILLPEFVRQTSNNYSPAR